jgi:hypothetical protein
MKRILIVLGIVLTIGTLTDSVVFGQTSEKKPIVEVFYSHSTNRCPGCMAIEKETTATLDQTFKKQLESGEIKFTIVNIDLKANKKLVDEYELWGSSLFMVKNGDKKTMVDLTKEGFASARSKPEVFRAKLTESLNEMLK